MSAPSVGYFMLSCNNFGTRQNEKAAVLEAGNIGECGKEYEYANTVDELMRVAGIEPPAAIEDGIGLARKLRVGSNMKLAL